MTSSDGRATRGDDDLAPVTDLFGARSRRAPGAGHPAPAGDARSGDALRGAAPAGDALRGAAPAGDALSGVAPASDARSSGAQSGDARSGGPHVPDDGWAASDGADADSPVPITGAHAQAEWVSPVVGDATGRSVRSERGGYDHDHEADAPRASVFAIVDGEELDPEDAPRPLVEQRADAERVSMRALGRRGVSTSEMRKTLAQHDLDPGVVEDEIDRLTRVGLLDDVALATDLVDRLHARKGLGRQGVVAELRRRGIDQVAIDTALDAAADDEDDEFVRALDLAAKRAGQLRDLDRETAERRLGGFLMRKGYNSGVVRIAVQRALDGTGRRPASGPGTVRFE